MPTVVLTSSADPKITALLRALAQVIDDHTTRADLGVVLLVLRQLMTFTVVEAVRVGATPELQRLNVNTSVRIIDEMRAKIVELHAHLMAGTGTGSGVTH